MEEGFILGRGHVPSQFHGATSSNIEFHVQSMIDYNILAQCYLHVVECVSNIYPRDLETNTSD